MMTFTVHEPPGLPADQLERSEALVFVREGFTWSAAFLTPFWMIANGLWLALLAYLAILGLVEAVLWIAGASQQIAAWLLLAAHVLIGFEADGIRRWGLKRQGYTMIASVSGRSPEECERRFFEVLAEGSADSSLPAPQLLDRRAGRADWGTSHSASGGVEAMARLAIIDYGSGNLHSAAKAFERAARESGADTEVLVTSAPKDVLAADRVVLPGVGAFADCKRGLDAVAGMRDALETVVQRTDGPFSASALANS